MADDHLSDVFDLVEVRGVLTGGLAARGTWIARGPITHPLKFFTLLTGRAELRTEGLDTPLELQAGDVGILNNRGWVELRGGPDGVPRHEVGVQPDMPPIWPSPPERDLDDVFVGARIDLNPAGEALLSQALPAVSHVRVARDGASGLRRTVDHLFDELAGDQIGSAFAIRQHGQLLLLEMLRSYLEQSDVPPGWLRLLADERLRPAVALMHGEPGRTWGLGELARAAAMSRASFADRFRKVSGMPALAYLSRWRMMLAQRALNDEEARIAPLAAQLGYGSESAFSTAFKRELGISPSQYRRQLRNRSSAPASSDQLATL